MAVRATLVLVLVLLLSGCSGGDAATESAAMEDAAQDGAAAREGTTTETSGAAGRDDESAPGGYGDGEEQAADGDEPAGVPAEQLPDAPARTGDRIVKEGTVSLEIEQGQFDRAFTAVIAAARRHGGDVVGSSTRTGDDGDTFGSVTVRVPVDTFEDLLVGVGEIGITRSRDVDATDVTAEYTDLESRLRHLRAQEAFYLGLLERAESVRDAIAVQQQLDGIQNQIERIQGRLNLLEDRTSFSTLTVELFEPGAGGGLLAEEDAGARPTLARYWDTARDAFVNVIGAMLVVGLFALPLLIAAGAALVMWRVIRRPQPPRAGGVVQEEAAPVPVDK